MQQVVYQEQGSIELGIDGHLSRDEFKEIVHQLESLHTTHGRIDVMFDLRHLDGYDKSIAIEEYRFYRDHKDAVRRLALVSDRAVAKFFTELGDRFLDIEVKRFAPDRIEDARRWIFGSRLP